MWPLKKSAVLAVPFFLVSSPVFLGATESKTGGGGTALQGSLGGGDCSLWLCAVQGAWLALSLWLQQVKAGCNSSCNERFLLLVIFIGVGE